MDVGPYGDVAVYEEAPPVKFQAGSSHRLRIGEAHFVPVGIGAVAHELEGARETGVIPADLVAPTAGVGAFRMAQNELPCPADGSRKSKYRCPVDGARFVELQSGSLRNGDGSAPDPGGGRSRRQGDVIGKLASIYGHGSRVGGFAGSRGSNRDVQLSVAQLDQGLVPQFLAVGGPGDVVAVGVDAHGSRAARVNEAGDVLEGPRAVHECASGKNKFVGRHQARRAVCRSRRVEHQRSPGQRYRSRAQTLGRIEVEGTFHERCASREGVGTRVFNG